MKDAAILPRHLANNACLRDLANNYELFGKILLTKHMIHGINESRNILRKE